ncbi:MAG TPA: hypothetical protein ENN10_03730 [Actinobacteria bacterium]|nr:hypothetical protein [Actinomycetota bacterium]
MRKRVVAAVALMAVVALTAGCDIGATTDEATSPGAVSPPSDQVTSPGVSTDTSASATTDTDVPVDNAYSPDDLLPAPGDQEAISLELETIIRELDEMSLPDDTDFRDVEDALE